MRIDVAGKCWIIPAHYGIWIPNNTEHAVWALDDVYLENLDIKPGFLEESINECKVVAISDFARSLFITPRIQFQVIMIASQKRANWLAYWSILFCNSRKSLCITLAAGSRINQSMPNHTRIPRPGAFS
jgi:hypothetical protein